MMATGVLTITCQSAMLYITVSWILIATRDELTGQQLPVSPGMIEAAHPTPITGSRVTG